MKTFKYVLIPVLLLTLTGCATSRTHLDIAAPAVDQASAESKGRQIYIRSLTDSRQFQEHPPSADIPSLRGGAAKASSELKSSAIGRKRNSFGKALGDYVLAEERTVEGLISQLTRNSLISLGYEVTDNDKEAKPDAIILDITIEKFWSWFAPGFSAIQIKSDITTTNKFTFTGEAGKTVVIEAHAVNSYQIASNSNWKKTIAAVLEDFSDKARAEFKKVEA